MPARKSRKLLLTLHTKFEVQFEQPKKQRFFGGIRQLKKMTIRWSYRFASLCYIKLKTSFFLISYMHHRHFTIWNIINTIQKNINDNDKETTKFPFYISFSNKFSSWIFLMKRSTDFKRIISLEIMWNIRETHTPKQLNLEIVVSTIIIISLKRETWEVIPTERRTLAENHQEIKFARSNAAPRLQTATSLPPLKALHRKWY